MLIMPAKLERCVKKLVGEGKSESSAYAICTDALKKSKKGVDMYEEGDKLFIKTFLINDTVNKIGWGVDSSTLAENIKSFIGKPLVVMEDFEHPDSGDTLDHQMNFQEKFRIGDILDITEKNGDYSAIIEVTDEEAKEAFKVGNLPMFVSPQIYHELAPVEGAIAKTWEGTHVALVKNPAWGANRATVSNECSGGAETCLAQLKQGSCHFCIKDTINNFIVSKNKSGNDSSNINKKHSKPSLTDKEEGSNETNSVSIEDFNKIKEQLEQEQAKSKVLEETNQSLKSNNDSNAEKVKALELEFRTDKISEILRDAQYANDEARSSAITSFTKSGMNYDEIRGHVAHLKTKSGSTFTSKIPAQEESKKTKSGSNDEAEENTDNFANALTIYKYGLGVAK